MEMGRNSRRGRGQSSSSSSFVRSDKHQSNPTRHGRASNPNPKNYNKSWDEPTSTTTNTGNDDSKSTDSANKQNQEKCLDNDDDPSFNSLPSLVGTCPFMCPSEERVQRERLQDLAVFERLYGDPRKSSSSLAVKKFCRTISTKHMQASDVRPLLVLEDTLNYLLNLLDSSVHPFEVVHGFIFDRTRSIRQDLSMQNIISDRAINMFEKMVSFYIVSHYKLQRCSDSPNTSPLHHLNMEQLTKALTSLYNLYEANRSSDSVYENEAEFRSFYVLLHLGSDCQSMGESLSLWFCRVPSPIIKSKEMSFARKVLRYFRLGNYKRFICTIAAEASYLQFCTIEPYINEVRVLALSSVNYGGYKLHPYPLEDLSKLLMMKGSEMGSFCNDCGLETLTDEVGKKFLPAKQTSFHHPKIKFQNYCLSGSERLERVIAEGSKLLRL